MEDTAVPRKVIFDPKVKKHKFQITPSPKAKTSSKSFAKEVLKGATEILLPSAFPKPADSPIRPIKGTHKSYAELLEELYPEEVKVEPKNKPCIIADQAQLHKTGEVPQHLTEAATPDFRPTVPPKPEPTSNSTPLDQASEHLS